jgi:N-acetylneuraminate synthase
MSVYIIAEAGVNHNGDMELAKKLIDAAKDANCDAVKFQTFNTASLVTQNAAKSEYQKINTENNDTQFEMLKELEIDKQQHIELIDYCRSRNIKFMSTPFDFQSVDLLSELGFREFKISSGDLNNKPFLQYIAKNADSIILSTGMGTLDEIREAVKWIEESNSQCCLALLHCTSSYPCNFNEINLNAITTMKKEFGNEIGFSDHSSGIEASLGAVALGAVIIEKHFTLDKTMPGPDHSASLCPEELKALVLGIRNIELSMGDGIKKPQKSEISNIKSSRKSIVAMKNIKKGDLIDSEMITVKRPGNGLPPELLEKYINKISENDYKKDDLFYG